MKKYGAEVLGIDLASNMVGIAWERAPQHKDANVGFFLLIELSLGNFNS